MIRTQFFQQGDCFYFSEIMRPLVLAPVMVSKFRLSTANALLNDTKAPRDLTQVLCREL